MVTWRGFGGKDAHRHILTGEISASYRVLALPYRVLAADSLDADLAWAPPRWTRAGRRGAAGATEYREDGTVGVEPAAATGGPRAGTAPPAPDAPLPPATMPRLTALGIALKAFGDDPVAHANGYICRESFSLADRPQSFYMIGSMGLAPAIGLGLALTQPARRAVVFDGDGNLLMNLGILAMIAAQRPANFVHLVFDNEVYGSTGNQVSLSRGVRLDRLAAAAASATREA